MKQKQPTGALVALGLLAAIAAVVLVVAVAGPGGPAGRDDAHAGASRVPADAIALVAGRPVPRAELTHWLGVLRRAGGTSAFTQLTDADVSYDACTAAILRHGRGGRAARARIAARFCARARTITTTSREALRRQAVRLVLLEAWLEGASASRRASASPAKVTRAIAVTRRQLGATRYRQLQRRVGMTDDDMRRYLAAGLELRSLGLTRPGPASSRFLTRWTARTVCAREIRDIEYCGAR